MRGILWDVTHTRTFVSEMFCSANVDPPDQNRRREVLTRGEERADSFWGDTEHMRRHLEDGLWGWFKELLNSTLQP